MTPVGGLQGLVDGAAFLSAEHQAHLADLHGDESWDVDLTIARLRLTSASGTITEVGAQLLGTAAPGPGSWLWAWTGAHGFPDATVRAARAVRDHGGAPELTTGELPLTDELPHRLALAAKVVTGSWTHFAGTVAGGTQVWLLVDHPSFALPTPTVPRILRAITEGIGGVSVEDHQAALSSYARARGLPLHEQGGSVRLDAADGSVLVRFDGEHRIARLEGTSGPAAPADVRNEGQPDGDARGRRRRWFGRR